MPDTTFDFNFLAAMMDKPNLVRSLVPFFEALNQWPCQEPKLEVPTIYKAYIRPM